MMDATMLVTLQPVLWQLIKEEFWQKQSCEDVLQDLNVALIAHGSHIDHPLSWAKRWLRNRRIDCWRRESSKPVQFRSLTPGHDAESLDGSPLDAMIEVENRREHAGNRQRIHDAILLLPPCQRDAVAFELARARQSGEIEAKPPRKSHRSNLYKATNRLAECLTPEHGLC